MLRLLAFILAVIAILLSVLGVIDIASGALSGSVSDEVLGAVLLIVPAIAYFALRISTRLQGRAEFRAALEGGFAPDHQGWFDGSGLAISGVRKEILIASQGKQKAYRSSQLVGFRVSRTPSPFGGPDGIVGVIMALVGLIQVIIGYFTDGMFLEFSDGSTWRVMGLRKRDVENWQRRFAAAGLLPTT
jgi:hypothetical protein